MRKGAKACAMKMKSATTSSGIQESSPLLECGVLCMKIAMSIQRLRG